MRVFTKLRLGCPESSLSKTSTLIGVVTSVEQVITRSWTFSLAVHVVAGTGGGMVPLSALRDVVGAVDDGVGGIPVAAKDMLERAGTCGTPRRPVETEADSSVLGNLFLRPLQDGWHLPWRTGNQKTEAISTGHYQVLLPVDVLLSYRLRLLVKPLLVGIVVL